jgi:hypothetical protein
MLASLLYSIARLLVDLLSVRDREQAELQAEVLALRHQLRVLQRQVRRPRWHPGDRLVLATIIERLLKRRWSGPISQSRDDPALASRARAPQVGRLRQAPTPSSAGDGPRGHRPDPQVGSREPKVGVPPDPGRATEAGTPVFTRDCPQGDAVAPGATSAQAVNANVGGVRWRHYRAAGASPRGHRCDANTCLEQLPSHRKLNGKRGGPDRRRSSEVINQRFVQSILRKD